MANGEELNEIAYVARTLGRRDEALDTYWQAAQAFDGAGEPLKGAHALRHVADLQLELGNLDAARESIEGVLQAYGDREVGGLERAKALRIAALVAEAEGRAEEARQMWADARELYAQDGIEAAVSEADKHLRG